jgi:hypothetical protein
MITILKLSSTRYLSNPRFNADIADEPQMQVKRVLCLCLAPLAVDKLNPQSRINSLTVDKGINLDKPILPGLMYGVVMTFFLSKNNCYSSLNMA